GLRICRADAGAGDVDQVRVFAAGGVVVGDRDLVAECAVGRGRHVHGEGGGAAGRDRRRGRGGDGGGAVGGVVDGDQRGARQVQGVGRAEVLDGVGVLAGHAGADVAQGVVAAGSNAARGRALHVDLGVAAAQLNVHAGGNF